ncbi:MAG: diaminopimelate decarboxylase [Candidatus Latescibacteria bacterium]|jgi:diaminopimelate decarboxylase|nr:diaminopimelate decarboxylase [Candidatus Latescibacterota bacterium]
MHYFSYKDGVFNSEDVALSEIASLYGTPTYVYSRATLERHIRTIDGAFNGIDHLTCYSVKANSNGAVLSILAQHGIGADVVSGGELFRALRAGIPASCIVYSGVGKTAEEIRYALDNNILMLNVESESELHTIDRIAGEMNRKAPISFRVNPDVDPKTHPYTATGLKKSKFGIPASDALRIYELGAQLKNIEVLGIDAHIGSQLTDVSPFRDAAERLAGLIDRIRSLGLAINVVDIGGGLGINYDDEFPPGPAEWAQMIVPIFKNTGCRLIIEPGRSIVGNAGVLITRVLHIKSNEEKTFIIVDAGMNDLLRPALYGSYHEVVPVEENSTERRVVDVVGPICESGDFIAKDRELAMPKEGDLLAIMSAGAYCMTMSSNYNSRPRAAEIMVSGNEAKLVTKRETYDSIISQEQL